MGGILPLLPPYAFMAWTGTTLPLTRKVQRICGESVRSSSRYNLRVQSSLLTANTELWKELFSVPVQGKSSTADQICYSG